MICAYGRPRPTWQRISRRGYGQTLSRALLNRETALVLASLVCVLWATSLPVPKDTVHTPPPEPPPTARPLTWLHEAPDVEQLEIRQHDERTGGEFTVRARFRHDPHAFATLASWHAASQQQLQIRHCQLERAGEWDNRLTLECTLRLPTQATPVPAAHDGPRQSGGSSGGTTHWPALLFSEDERLHLDQDAYADLRPHVRGYILAGNGRASLWLDGQEWVQAQQVSAGRDRVWLHDMAGMPRGSLPLRHPSGHGAGLAGGPRE